MYTLELFPVSEEARDLYTRALGGSEKVFAANDNAGFDLHLAKDVTVHGPFSVVLLELGVRARLRHANGETAHYWLVPRSSIWKSGVVMANSVGVIDRTYRGQLMAPVMSVEPASVLTEPRILQKGLRLFQIVAPEMGFIEKVRLCDDSELDTTVRGEGGFGSTGRA